MPNAVEGYISTKILQFLLTLVGMKRGNTKREQMIINALLVYTIVNICIAIFVENSDLIYSRNDLYALTYNAPCSFTVTFDFIKLLIFTYKRRELHDLHKFADETFWNKEYNELDKKILDKCNTTNTIGMSFLIGLSICVGIHYLAGPYLDVLTRVALEIFIKLDPSLLRGNENLPMHLDAMGTNATVRELPFRIIYDLPVAVTPYYEILYVIEVIGAITVGVCSVAFASYLYYTCIFVSGQFKILQRELEEVCEIQLESAIIKSSYNNNDNDTMPAYTKLKKCIRQHQLLIWYLDRLETLFCYILLMLVLCVVIILCFSAFQVLLGTETTSIHRQILSIQYLISGLQELVLFAFSCNEILEASAAIGEAAYRCKWYNLPCDEDGRAVRQGLTIMVMRSYKPCTLSVGKFCPMTLQVFTSVLSTTLSYFTVLRGMNED